jgi:hypothetical protein
LKFTFLFSYFIFLAGFSAWREAIIPMGHRVVYVSIGIGVIMLVDANDGSSF